MQTPFDGELEVEAALETQMRGHADHVKFVSLICSNSSSVNSIPAEATFSSRCFSLDVPGIGSITGERLSSHASAS
jgi:hypothetical protein